MNEAARSHLGWRHSCHVTGFISSNYQYQPHNADNLRFALWSKPVDLVCSTSAMSDEKSQEEQDRQVEIWKMKKLIKTLTESRGFVVVLQQRSLELCHDGEFDSLQERNQYDFSGNPSW